MRTVEDRAQGWFFVYTENQVYQESKTTAQLLQVNNQVRKGKTGLPHRARFSGALVCVRRDCPIVTAACARRYQCYPPVLEFHLWPQGIHTCGSGLLVWPWFYSSPFQWGEKGRHLDSKYVTFAILINLLTAAHRPPGSTGPQASKLWE